MSKSEIMILSVLCIGSLLVILFYFVNDYYNRNKLKQNSEYFHWYNVTFTYRNKDLKMLFDFTLDIGLKNQKDILNSRILKKSFTKLNKNKSLTQSKQLLCNGSLATRINSYLGHFPNPNINQKKK